MLHIPALDLANAAPLALAGDRIAPLPPFAILAETAGHVAAREALLDRAMGAGRKKKSSEAIRRGRLPASGLSFVAIGPDGSLLATLRLWHVTLGENGTQALLLGPLAVEPSAQGLGLGGSIMRHAIASARELGHGAILLVGDPDYYARFGFSAAATAHLAMPGPFEPHRLLALELKAGALQGAQGVITGTGPFAPSSHRRRRPDRVPAVMIA
ncbi:N-acetyltransferase [Fulvimarina endophytica]|uniref:N-acetyltransferase n=1 Tax=Fulvimarina endophytica TaxID=2293836 RepID=A0A371X8K8_9HYPH|nr:N-acetyltransferase [Fulvimarina endophytica]RFC65404.1 N-acetyltransferase [Fulvimarina endophytica]